MTARASERVPSLVAAAVDAMISGDESVAREALEGIDYEGLLHEREALMASVRQWVQGHQTSARRPRIKRKPVSEKEALSVFIRDGFACRYAHCQKQVLYSPVLAVLSRAFPDLLGRHPEYWGRKDQPSERDKHIVFWTCTQSLEHMTSFTYGGTSHRSNLVTACSQCNYAKNEHPLIGELWQVVPEPPETRWDGLLGKLPRLRAALGISQGGRLPDQPRVGLPSKGSLIRVTGHACPYRVDTVSEGSVELRMMWRSVGRWTLERKSRWLPTSDLEWTEVYPEAPEPDSPV